MLVVWLYGTQVAYIYVWIDGTQGSKLQMVLTVDKRNVLA